MIVRIQTLLNLPIMKLIRPAWNMYVLISMIRRTSELKAMQTSWTLFQTKFIYFIVSFLWLDGLIKLTCKRPACRSTRWLEIHWRHWWKNQWRVEVKVWREVACILAPRLPHERAVSVISSQACSCLMCWMAALHSGSCTHWKPVC